MKRQTPEGAIKTLIGEYLTLRRIEWHRMNAGVIRKGGRFIQGHKKGTPDILAFVKLPCCDLKHSLWIETKRPKGGKTSAAQDEFIANAEANGHITMVATSLEEVERKLREIKAI